MMRLFILFTLCLTFCANLSQAQEICNNNFDDDGDGLVDCRDGECASKVCEVCDNGLDDDGDGFIDCYDKECSRNESCRNFFLNQDANCELKPDTFPPFGMRLKFKSEPNQTNHMNRIVAGDINSDGIPELVTAYAAKTGTGSIDKVSAITASKINVFGAPTLGAKLNLQKSIDVTMGGLEAVGYEDIAMADINSDGCAEIFVVTKNLSNSANFKIVSYDCNGNPVWTTPISFTFDPGLMGLADFDHDGLVELYSRTQIFDAHTGALLGNNNIDNVNTGIHSGVNSGWGMNSNAPVTVDILPANPGLELVAGCRIYGVTINRGGMTATLSLLKEYNQYATRTSRGRSNPTSVADFNQDGYLDVLAVGSDGKYDDNTTIFFWDVENNVVKKYQDFFGTADYIKGWKSGAGRINIADVDGDSLMNAVYVSGKYLYALKEGPTGLNVVWRENITEETSGHTGCTVFDFNGDGRVEVVYRDENYMYVYTTQPDGVVIRSTPIRCASRTHDEYPIVVDVDNDGSAELCVTYSTSNTMDGKNIDLWGEAEVRVYESSNVPWIPARNVVNQHAYFVVNVNDNLTIPRQQQQHHLVYAKDAPCRNGGMNRPLNAFMNQVSYLNSSGCISYPAPDLSVVPFSSTQWIGYAPFTCVDDSIRVTFKYTNKGDVSVHPGESIEISLYDNDPRLQNFQANRFKTQSFLTPGINPGDTITTTMTIRNPGKEFNLFVSLNDDEWGNHFIRECMEGNVISGHIVPNTIPLVSELIQANLTCESVSGVPVKADNGAVKVYASIDGISDVANFDFYWSRGYVVKPPASIDHVGQTYSALASGAYTVYAMHKTLNCLSDTLTVVVNEISSRVDARVIQEKDFDNDEHPNGELRVIVNDIDNNGVGDPENNFNYAWYAGQVILVGDTLGTSHTLTELGAGTYSVLVHDRLTGCYDSAYATINRKEIVLGEDASGDITGVSLYPNPGTEDVVITIDNEYVGVVQLQLLSMAGNEVDKMPGIRKDARKLKVPMDTRKYKPGVYLVKISLGKATLIQKWTKL